MLQDHTPFQSISFQPSVKLNQDLIFSQLNSQDEYPIDFDDAWKWLGYGRKEEAIALVFDELDHEKDFLIEIRQLHPLASVLIPEDMPVSLVLQSVNRRLKNEINEAEIRYVDAKEKLVSNILQQRLGGEREVKNENGLIDLLTQKLVIEVKLNFSNAAIGQVLGYAQNYPRRKPAIFTPTFSEKASRECEKFGVIYLYPKLLGIKHNFKVKEPKHTTIVSFLETFSIDHKIKLSDSSFMKLAKAANSPSSNLAGEQYAKILGGWVISQVQELFQSDPETAMRVKNQAIALLEEE